MAKATVTVVAASLPPGHQRAVVKCAGKAVELPITSPQTEHDGWAGDWQQQPRPLDRPLIGMAALQLATTKLTCTITRKDGTSVESTLRTLAEFAEDADHHVTVANYGAVVAGPWRITGLSTTADRRTFASNRISRAQVTFTLTEAIPDPNPKATKPKNAKSKTKRPAAYIVMPGDTLPGIAARFYGHADFWRPIAAFNGIADPRAVGPGMVLRLP